MRSIEIIMLRVADRQKAKEFYLNLGFKIIVEAPGAHGETWIQMGFSTAIPQFRLQVSRELFVKQIILKPKSKT